MPDLEQLTRFIAPSLAAVLLLLFDLPLVPELTDRQYGVTAKVIGLALPAFWLTSIGPHGLMRGGGLLMRLLRIRKPTNLKITGFGLTWLLVYILSTYALQQGCCADSFWQYPLAGIAHAGVMSALGVFAFLAVAQTRQR